MEELDIHDVVSISRLARQEMPPNAQFRPEDDEVIARNKEFLESLTDEVVEAFYDTVYGHDKTAAIFKEGERPERVESLKGWWRKTAQGTHGDEYFGWMAMVGLVHVVRGVSNPMMIAMADQIANQVADAARNSDIPSEEAQKLVDAVHRLMSTVSAVIAHGYDLAVQHSLYDIVGMPSALVQRLRNQSVSASLEQARAER